MPCTVLTISVCSYIFCLACFNITHAIILLKNEFITETRTNYKQTISHKVEKDTSRIRLRAH